MTYDLRRELIDEEDPPQVCSIMSIRDVGIPLCNLSCFGETVHENDLIDRCLQFDIYDAAHFSLRLILQRI